MVLTKYSPTLSNLLFYKTAGWYLSVVNYIRYYGYQAMHPSQTEIWCIVNSVDSQILPGHTHPLCFILHHLLSSLYASYGYKLSYLYFLNSFAPTGHEKVLYSKGRQWEAHLKWRNNSKTNEIYFNHLGNPMQSSKIIKVLSSVMMHSIKYK